MALVLKDRVKETTTTTGTGTITLAGAVVGYQTFSAIGDSNTTYYVIEDADGAGWEVGIGTYTLSGTTLARTTVLASTNSNSQITLSSGTHTVFCSYPAGKSVNTADNLSVMAATTSAQLAGVISDETGSGSVVFATSPTLVTPALGTPSALVATNATGTAASLTAGTATLATDATSITVSANNTADETVYPLFVDGATGSQGAETDTGLTYNPSSGLLTSTLFAGALTGNVTGNASGSSGSCTGNASTVTTNANLTGHITSTGNAAVLGSFTVAQLSTALSDASISGSNTGDQTTVSGSSGSCTGNAATATLATDATSITVSANNTAAETVYPLFVDGATGSQGAETDTGLTYNPNTGLLTSTLFAGALTGNVTGDASGSSGSCTGNAATVTTNANLTGHITSTGNAAILGSFTVAQLSTAISDASISGNNTGDQTTVSGSSGSCTGNAATATVATTVTITDNESTVEDNAIIFAAGGDIDGGNLGLESDGTLTYNPSTGKITATGFIGALTGDASGSSGSCTGNAATVTNGVYTSNNLSVMAATTSAQLAGVISDETGSGALVFATSPTLVTPALGTPSALVATNASGTAASLTAGTATVATTVTITDNESTAEDNAIIFAAGGDIDGGNLGLESDGTLTYNPSTGTVTSTVFAGALTGNASGSSGSCTGNAATVTNGVYTTNNLSVMAATTSAQLAGVISDETGSGALVFATSPTLVTPALGTPSALVATNASGTAASLTAGTATVATTVTITDNESTNENNAIIFTAGGDLDGGNLGLESDGDLHYNPSTGTVTATVFVGALTGNVTGNASGSALTVTQAAQSAITSVGTLTSVVVADGGNIGSASDTDAISIGADGGVTLTKALIGPVGSGALSGSDTDVTIDWATGNYHEVTLNTANIDAVIFHNVTVGQRVIIRIQNDNAAARTITWTVTSGTGTSPSSATVSWAGGTAPTMTATVDKADTYGFICRSATTFDGFVIGQNI